MAQHVTEGGNAAAKRIAEQIDRLRDEVKDRHRPHHPGGAAALPVASGTRGEHRHRERRTETTASRTSAPTPSDSWSGRPCRKPTVEELANVMTELSDGQISPIWYAIRDLNAKLIDPKDALESASRIIRRQ